MWFNCAPYVLGAFLVGMLVGFVVARLVWFDTLDEIRKKHAEIYGPRKP